MDDGVPVQWKETQNGFEAVFKGIGFTDLGAPLGEEEAWAEQFSKTLRDPRLSSIDLREVAGGLKVVGQWKFPSGPSAPADPRMETFNFREHSPGEFVVDFWLKKGITVAEAEALRKKQAQQEKIRRAKAEIDNRVSRRIASEKAKSEINDLGRFCSEPLSEKKDVFLSFLPVSERIDYQKELPHGAPDAQYPYYEPKGNAQDAQYVRLALKLYHEEKYGLVVRTLDFLDTEQPSSSYRTEMRFLRANALLKLGMQAEGERILSDLRAEAKGKPAALHSALYLASKLLEPVEGKEFRFKDPLAAYETFSWFFTHYPDHRLAWLFHLGAAEALSAIKQTEQAAKEYLWVAENARSPEQRAQGALRLGNVYLERRELPRALEAYTRALRYFRKESESYPAIHLNRGETLYGLGEYEEARKIFEDFTNKYSGYPHGWRATYRLGEILGRQDASPIHEAASRKWFYDTINLFPLSPGATLARLRLISCGDHGGFTYESASRFFDGEAKNFDASGEVSMVRYPDHRALAQLRAYITLEHDDAAIDIAQRELSLTKVAPVKAELGRMYEELFRKNILNLLDQGKPYDALSFYEERSKFRPKDVPSIDPDYLLRLSLAASRLGLGKKAEFLADAYHQASAPKRSIAQASSNSSSGPSGLDARLRVSEEKFAEARALWISGDTSKESELGAKNADKVRAQLDQVVAESPYSFEKEVILGLLEEKHGKLKTARGHILKAQVLAPAGKGEESEETSLQLLSWLAGIEAKAGDSKTALAMYKSLESKLVAREKQEEEADSEEEGEGDAEVATEPEEKKVATTASFLGVALVQDIEQILLNQGVLLDSMKRWGETASVYHKAVEQGLGGNQAMYGYARALLKTGGKASREKAKVALQKLTESKTEDFWKKLARETLADLQLKGN